MAASHQLKSLVAQMPDPDERRMFTQNIDQEKIEQAIAQIAAGGPDFVRGLIDLLGPPGSPEDVKPHYALHCLGNYFLIKKDEPGRQAFAKTLAAELGGTRPAHVQAFLCQELQWAGRQEAVPALGSLLLNEELVESAAMALTALREGAAAQFRAALPKAQGKCRLNVLQGLGAVDDAASTDSFIEALQDPDPQIRIVAGWSLARLAQPKAIAPLLQAADQAQAWERIQGNKHCLILAENLAASGRTQDATRIYQHLQTTRTDPAEKHIRDAAQRGLSQA